MGPEGIGSAGRSVDGWVLEVDVGGAFGGKWMRFEVKMLARP